MTVPLSGELLQEIARQGNRPIRVVDPDTHRVYVLITAEAFERMTSLFEESADVRDTYEAQDAALARIWSDEELDEYADYDRHKQSP